MPEPSVAETPAWIAQLPDDLKQNPAFTSFKTVGDFAKDYLSNKGKVGELTGRLEHSIPKLPENATDEDRSLYYDALGRPKQASEYQFEGEDKNAPEWTNYWKGEMHKLGLTGAQAKQLSGLFNGQIQKMVTAHNDSLKASNTAAEQKLRSEMGEKFDTNVELAKRMTQKHLGTEFDATFAGLNGDSRFAVMRLLLKVAQLTGEDSSPTSVQRPKAPTGDGNPYPKSNMPPARQTAFMPPIA